MKYYGVVPKGSSTPSSLIMSIDVDQAYSLYYDVSGIDCNTGEYSLIEMSKDTAVESVSSVLYIDDAITKYPNTESLLIKLTGDNYRDRLSRVEPSVVSYNNSLLI